MDGIDPRRFNNTYINIYTHIYLSHHYLITGPLDRYLYIFQPEMRTHIHSNSPCVKWNEFRFLIGLSVRCDALSLIVRIFIPYQTEFMVLQMLSRRI